jgi:hypothetical protein
MIDPEDEDDVVLIFDTLIIGDLGDGESNFAAVTPVDEIDDAETLAWLAEHFRRRPTLFTDCVTARNEGQGPRSPKTGRVPINVQGDVRFAG